MIFLNSAKERLKSSLTILRPAMVYGPQAPGNFARISKLIKIGIPLPFGSFKNKRHFLFVDNLVQFITNALEDLSPGVKVSIASDEMPLSTKDLILLAAQWEEKTPHLFPFPPKILKYILILLGKKDEWEKIGSNFEVNR